MPISSSAHSPRADSPGRRTEEPSAVESFVGRMQSVRISDDAGTRADQGAGRRGTYNGDSLLRTLSKGKDERNARIAVLRIEEELARLSGRDLWAHQVP